MPPHRVLSFGHQLLCWRRASAIRSIEPRVHTLLGGTPAWGSTPLRPTALPVCGLMSNISRGLRSADIVAKSNAEQMLWNRNLKQSNRDACAFESTLLASARF